MATSSVAIPFTQRGWSGHFTYQFRAAISRIPNNLRGPPLDVARLYADSRACRKHGFTVARAPDFRTFSTRRRAARSRRADARPHARGRGATDGRGGHPPFPGDPPPPVPPPPPPPPPNPPPPPGRGQPPPGPHA